MAYFIVISQRGPGWDWALPLRRQAQWDEHAAFMDRLANEGFILAGGPLGGEDDALRVLHIVEASERSAIELRLAEDPWTPRKMLRLESIEPWTVLLGALRR